MANPVSIIRCWGAETLSLGTVKSHEWSLYREEIKYVFEKDHSG